RCTLFPSAHVSVYGCNLGIFKPASRFVRPAALCYAQRSSRRPNADVFLLIASAGGKSPTRSDAPSCLAEPTLPDAPDLLRTRRAVHPAQAPQPRPPPP